MADNESIIVEPPENEASYPDIYLIQEGDQVKGGEEGLSNKQAIGLVKRTQWLRIVLMQLLGMIQNLGSQGTVGTVKEPGNGGGVNILDMNLAFGMYYKTETGYDVQLRVLSGDPVVATVFIKQYTPNGIISSSKTNLSIDSTGVSLFEEAIPFDNVVEVDVRIALKAATFSAKTADEGVTAYINGKLI